LLKARGLKETRWGRLPPLSPEEKAVMSIYGGSAPHESRHKLKLTGRAINTVSASVPEYLCWPESSTTFDKMDHTDSIPMLGRFPLIVDLLVGTTQLTKVLMDGGNDLNLMYLDTFEGLGLTHDKLQINPHPFYGVVLGKWFVPLEQVTLPVTFRDVSNYHIETLTFEVVDIFMPYHILMGWSCYIKFMPIPSYAYLKLTIPRPARVITVEAKTQWALDCEQDNIELVVPAVTVIELWELSLQIPTVTPSLAMPMVSAIFKIDEDTKVIQIDDGDPAKTMQIGASLDPK
jgi:hypothetical protein